MHVSLTTRKCISVIPFIGVGAGGPGGPVPPNNYTATLSQAYAIRGRDSMSEVGGLGGLSVHAVGVILHSF